MSKPKYPIPYTAPQSLPRAPRRRVIIIEEEIPLPKFMKHLSLFCTRHALPLPMRFLGESTADQGKPMAIYGCSDRYCRYQEGWVQSPHNGHPRRLGGALIEGQR
jgi:hypothetical protein